MGRGGGGRAGRRADSDCESLSHARFPSVRLPTPGVGRAPADRRGHRGWAEQNRRGSDEVKAMKHLNIVLLALAAASGSLSAQDPLSVAKDLYASAAYEDALSALARIKEGAPDLAQQVDQYRAFSLFALGRTAEAESVVETVIRRDPMVKPDSRDASPRIAALFTQVRKRLLPDLIRDGYRAARETMENGDIAGAVPQLQQVKGMLAELKAAGASNEALADMGVLVDGFLDLARTTERAAAESAAPAKAETAPSPPPAPVAAAADETIVNRPPAVYSANDKDVVAPVILR